MASLSLPTDMHNIENIITAISNLSLPEIAVASATIGLLALFIRGLLNPLRNVPGPWHTRWTGLVYLYWSLTGKGPKNVLRWHKTYGPVVRITPSWVATTSPEDAQTIHRIKNEFIKDPWYSRGAKVSSGTINLVFIQDVGVHRSWRRLLLHPLSESALKDVLPQVEADVKLAIQQIGNEMKTRGAADVYKWWMCMATDVIGELTFGESFQMLQTGKKNDFLRDVEAAGPLGAILSVIPWIEVLYILPRVLVPRIVEDITTFNERLRHHGSKLLDKYQHRLENDPKAPPTLFSKLIKAKDDDALSRRQLLDNAQIYILAGSDTTSNTLTYLVWQVCRHPQVKAKLVAEVSALPDDFTLQHLKDLPYLNQVISETLRLNNATPAALPRVVPKGGTTMSGHAIPAGMTVATQAYTLHRNEKAFPDPEKWDPDRWEHPTKEMKDSFMPFGGGSRACIGMHLAYHEVRLAATLFWRTFPNAKVSSLEGFCDRDMEQDLYFVMASNSHRCLIEAS